MTSNQKSVVSGCDVDERMCCSDKAHQELLMSRCSRDAKKVAEIWASQDGERMIRLRSTLLAGRQGCWRAVRFCKQVLRDLVDSAKGAKMSRLAKSRAELATGGRLRRCVQS